MRNNCTCLLRKKSRYLYHKHLKRDVQNPYMRRTPQHRH